MELIATPVERDPAERRESLRTKIEHAINYVSAENGSNTPDFILAEYLVDCLAAFDKASRAREAWYGSQLRPGHYEQTQL